MKGKTQVNKFTIITQNIGDKTTSKTLKKNQGTVYMIQSIDDNRDMHFLYTKKNSSNTRQKSHWLSYEYKSFVSFSVFPNFFSFSLFNLFLLVHPDIFILLLLDTASNIHIAMSKIKTMYNSRR